MNKSKIVPEFPLLYILIIVVTFLPRSKFGMYHLPKKVTKKGPPQSPPDRTGKDYVPIVGSSYVQRLHYCNFNSCTLLLGLNRIQIFNSKKKERAGPEPGMKPTGIYSAGCFEVWASEKIALRKSEGKE